MVDPYNSSSYSQYPGTALVTKWGSNTKLNPVLLSRFPHWGLKGLLDIVDPNITIPTFDNSMSKEGVLITMILYAHFVLDSQWEEEFRTYHPALKNVGVAKLAR